MLRWYIHVHHVWRYSLHSLAEAGIQCLCICTIQHPYWNHPEPVYKGKEKDPQAVIIGVFLLLQPL